MLRNKEKYKNIISGRDSASFHKKVYCISNKIGLFSIGRGSHLLLPVNLLLKWEETVTVDSSSKGSSAIAQTKKINFFLPNIKM